MQQLIKKLKNLCYALLRQDDYFTIEDTDSDALPFHIRQVGRMYPMLNYLDNESRGEIKRFVFTSTYRKTLPVGERVTTEHCSDSKNYVYHCIWVHLGNDYFKLVSKS
jgi:hypothetical protein